MPNIWTFTSRHFSVKQVELLREMAELRVETQAVQDNQTIFPCQKLGFQGYDMRGRATQTARNLRSCPSYWITALETREVREDVVQFSCQEVMRSFFFFFKLRPLLMGILQGPKAV